MPLMKASLFLIASILTLSVVGQDPTNLTVSLSAYRGNTRPVPTVLDTVFLNSSAKQTIKIFTNISTADTVFNIFNIPVGKYLLFFSTQSYCVSPIPITVCSKCDNHFFLFVYPKKKEDNCNLFELVEVEPGYNGGNKRLAKDFFRTLNNKEKKRLKAGTNFAAHFYVTKQKTISNITIVPSDLSEELKNIIVKGLTTVVDWKPAIINGTISDEEFVLDKTSLF